MIGYGSSLHSDDRFGLLVAQGLKAADPEDGVEIMITQQLLPELLEPLSLAQGAIFVDATTELPPGVARCIDLEHQELSCTGNSEAGSVFSHHFAPKELLEAARQAYGHAPRAWLYTVGGEDFNLGEELSAKVSLAIPKAVADIRSMLKDRPQ